ncbi:hypothetical protein Agub_g7492 [Astrephomene gubernaculifera]|uniref:Uncharacterized protein n=1 Tax=Astrephomene gubernaculifera TaxID=47775 RepID=A0AAD3DSU0_9CHLO|nr:hypothetical protein Agub_g7492 [Astrephomene gubernaculifera]
MTDGEFDVNSAFHADFRTVTALLLSILVGAVATAAGVGGGAIYIPLFNALVGFALKPSTALSQACITAGSLAALAANLPRRHPAAPGEPLIDFPLMVMLTPVLLVGVGAGVLLNVMLPSWLLTVLLLLLLLLLTTQAVGKGLAFWRLESQLKSEAAAAEAASEVLTVAASGTLDPEALFGGAGGSGGTVGSGGGFEGSDRTRSGNSSGGCVGLGALLGGHSAQRVSSCPVVAAAAPPQPQRLLQTPKSRAARSGGGSGELAVPAAAALPLQEMCHRLLGSSQQPVGPQEETYGTNGRSAATRRPHFAARGSWPAGTTDPSEQDLQQPLLGPQHAEQEDDEYGCRTTHSVIVLKGRSTIGGSVSGGTEEDYRPLATCLMPHQEPLPPTRPRSSPFKPPAAKAVTEVGGSREAPAGPCTATEPGDASGDYGACPHAKCHGDDEASKGQSPATVTPRRQPGLPPPLPTTPPTEPRCITLGAATSSEATPLLTHHSAAIDLCPHHGEYGSVRHSRFPGARRTVSATGTAVRAWGRRTAAAMRLIPLRYALALLAAWALYLLLQVLRGSHARCSSSWWALFAVQVIAMLGITVGAVAMAAAEQRASRRADVGAAATVAAPVDARVMVHAARVAAPGEGVQAASNTAGHSFESPFANANSLITIAAHVNNPNQGQQHSAIAHADGVAPTAHRIDSDSASSTAATGANCPGGGESPAASGGAGVTEAEAAALLVLGAPVSTLCATALAGLVGGFLGLGGGMMIGPLLLHIGVQPQVTAATSGAMVLFSSSSALIQFALLHRLNVPYAAVFGAASLVAGLVGTHVVAGAVRHSGRPSLVVMALAGVMAVGTLSVGSFGLVRALEDLRAGRFGFAGLCDGSMGG